MNQKHSHLTNSYLAEALWGLSQKAFEHGSPWSVQQFQADLENPNSFYELKLNEEELVGYLIFHKVLDEAEVINIAVLPAFKGQAIALELLEKGLKKLQVNQVKQVFLEVRESNQPARRLYQKAGFQEIGRRKQYYHQPLEDGIVMKRFLVSE